MRAKQFFYVCAGILMLMAATRYPVPGAMAQGPQLVLVEQYSNTCQIAVDPMGRIFERGGPGGGNPGPPHPGRRGRAGPGDGASQSIGQLTKVSV